MHLSTSTVPNDSNLAALLFPRPGAGPAPGAAPFGSSTAGAFEDAIAGFDAGPVKGPAAEDDAPVEPILSRMTRTLRALHAGDAGYSAAAPGDVPVAPSAAGDGSGEGRADPASEPVTFQVDPALIAEQVAASGVFTAPAPPTPEPTGESEGAAAQTGSAGGNTRAGTDAFGLPTGKADGEDTAHAAPAMDDLANPAGTVQAPLAASVAPRASDRAAQREIRRAISAEAGAGIPAGRTARPLPEEPEKFAAAVAEEAALPVLPESGGIKTFVNAGNDAVMSEAEDLGTTIAEAVPVMSNRVTPPSLLHPENGYAAGGVNASGTGVDAAAGSAPALPESVSTAHQAVEAVLRAADQASSRGASSVNLRFSVGENELAVRVELHGQEVRTTFRTDSPELRAALFQEWQAVASQPADRGFRLAPAVFSSSDTGSQDASSGDASPRQQERDARHSEADTRAGFDGFAGSRRAVSAPPPRPAAAAPAASLTAHRLLSFA